MRTPQQALKDAIDSGAVQAWIDGKKIEYQNQQDSRWGGVPIGRPGFTAPEYFWRVAPPDPPKPTIVDWQPIETCPENTLVLMRWSCGTIQTLTYHPTTQATHWAPVPAPPQGDE